MLKLVSVIILNFESNIVFYVDDKLCYEILVTIMKILSVQMAFELYGMLAGNVSPMTGENVKPAYGGDEEAFLKKVVTPIYEVIARVYSTLDRYADIFHYIELFRRSFNKIGVNAFFQLTLIFFMFRKLQGVRKGNPNTLSGEIMMI